MKYARQCKRLSLILVLALIMAQIQVLPSYAERVSTIGSTKGSALANTTISKQEEIDFESLDSDVKTYYDARYMNEEGQTISTEESFMTPVKSQGDLGLCWDYAFMGVLEAACARNGLGKLDFWESHMDYALTSNGNNSTNSEYEDESMKKLDFASELFKGESDYVHEEGSGSMGELGIEYVSQGVGPYLQEGHVNGIDKTMSIDKLTDKNGRFPITIEKSVKKGYHANLAHQDLQENGQESSYVKEIKTDIIDKGPCYVGISIDTVWDTGSTCKFVDNVKKPDQKTLALREFSEYETGGENVGGHALVCVGWDDSVPKDYFTGDMTPQGDGAWIVKNSWGNIGTSDGYMYISYYDKAFYETQLYIPEVSAKDTTLDNYYCEENINNGHTIIGNSPYVIRTYKRSNPNQTEYIKEIQIYLTSYDMFEQEVELYVIPDKQEFIQAAEVDVDNGKLDIKSDLDSYKVTGQLANMRGRGIQTVMLDKPIMITGEEYMIGGHYISNGERGRATLARNSEEYQENTRPEDFKAYTSQDGTSWWRSTAALKDGKEYYAPCLIRPLTVNGIESVDSFVVAETSRTDDSLTVSWDAQENVDGYTIEVIDFKQQMFEQQDLTAYGFIQANTLANRTIVKVEGGETSSYTLNNLEKGKAYFFRIHSNAARKGIEMESKNTMRIKGTTKPGKVTGLCIGTSFGNGIGNNSITCQWDVMADSEYEVYLYVETDLSTPLRILPQSTSPGTVTSTILTGLRPSTEYAIKVRSLIKSYPTAEYEYGEFSDILKVKTLSKPASMGEITQEGATLDSATLCWDTVEGANYYKIQYGKEIEDDYTTIEVPENTNSTRQSYTITGLASGINYKSLIITPLFKTDAATISGAPKAFTNLKTKAEKIANITISNVTSDSAEISWVNSSDYSCSIRLYEGNSSKYKEYLFGRETADKPASVYLDHAIVKKLKTGVTYKVEVICGSGVAASEPSEKKAFTTGSKQTDTENLKSGVKSLRFKKNAVKVKVKKTLKLTISITPAKGLPKASKKMRWSITKGGKFIKFTQKASKLTGTTAVIKGVKKGKAVVTVKAPSGKKATCKITVR